MNEDTNELLLWIINEDEYKYLLMAWVDTNNELFFIDTLVDIIHDINTNKLDGDGRIEYKNINGNELWIEFSKRIGNERQGWCQK